MAESFVDELHVDIEQERAHIREFNNSQGIQWTFQRNSDRTFSRIVCGPGLTGNIVLEVHSMTESNWPVVREATLPEIFRFLRLARSEMPTSPHVELLSNMAHQRLDTEELKLASLRSLI